MTSRLPGTGVGPNGAGTNTVGGPCRRDRHGAGRYATTCACGSDTTAEVVRAVPRLRCGGRGGDRGPRRAVGHAAGDGRSPSVGLSDSTLQASSASTTSTDSASPATDHQLVHAARVDDVAAGRLDCGERRRRPGHGERATRARMERLLRRLLAAHRAEHLGATASTDVSAPACGRRRRPRARAPGAPSRPATSSRPPRSRRAGTGRRGGAGRRGPAPAWPGPSSSRPSSPSP